MNETDRELLEWAAKAIGKKIVIHAETPSSNAIYFCIATDGSGASWNPLTDDGDALRLAVKLNMDIDVGRRDVVAMWSDRENGEVYEVKEPGEKSGGDPLISARRAIVRAAAEIGKAMP